MSPIARTIRPCSIVTARPQVAWQKRQIAVVSVTGTPDARSATARPRRCSTLHRPTRSEPVGEVHPVGARRTELRHLLAEERDDIDAVELVVEISSPQRDLPRRTLRCK